MREKWAVGSGQWAVNAAQNLRASAISSSSFQLAASSLPLPLLTASAHCPPPTFPAASPSSKSSSPCSSCCSDSWAWPRSFPSATITPARRPLRPSPSPQRRRLRRAKGRGMLKPEYWVYAYHLRDDVLVRTVLVVIASTDPGLQRHPADLTWNRLVPAGNYQPSTLTYPLHRRARPMPSPARATPRPSTPWPRPRRTYNGRHDRPRRLSLLRLFRSRDYPAGVNGGNALAPRTPTIRG